MVIRCKALAVLKVTQKRKSGTGRERNDRIIGVPVGERSSDVPELSRRLRRELENFFQSAVFLEGKDIRFGGWGRAWEAKAIIRAGQRAFEADQRSRSYRANVPRTREVPVRQGSRFLARISGQDCKGRDPTVIFPQPFDLDILDMRNSRFDRSAWAAVRNALIAALLLAPLSCRTMSPDKQAWESPSALGDEEPWEAQFPGFRERYAAFLQRLEARRSGQGSRSWRGSMRSGTSEPLLDTPR
jgi:hypothetical protein